MALIMTDLEGREPKIVLMGYADDASGHTFGRFYDYEEICLAIDSMERYIHISSLPVIIYPDKPRMYKTTLELSLNVLLRAEDAKTKIGRALNELGTKIIHVHSYQAKGKNEGLFGTSHDRLINEMRFASI